VRVTAPGFNASLRRVDTGCGKNHVWRGQEEQRATAIRKRMETARGKWCKGEPSMVGSLVARCEKRRSVMQKNGAVRQKNL